MNIVAKVVAGAMLVLWPLAGFAAPDMSRCVGLDTRTVYHDINDPGSSVNLNTVETNHFIRDVEYLRRGQTAPLPFDIDFVLRAFPNHYRALNAMATWQLKNSLPATEDGRLWTADCYFDRAITFVPDDWRVRMIYGIYLHRAKRVTEAQEQYDGAERLGGEEAETSVDYNYNRALMEIDAGNLPKARLYADRAYELGAALPGLSQKLARAEQQVQVGGSGKKPR